MGNHHRLGLRRVGRLELRHIDVVLRNGHIHKDRDRPVLQHRRDRRRESAGHGDAFIAATNAPLAELRGSQRHEGEQVRARARVHERHKGDAEIGAEFLLKEIRVAPGGQPEFEDRIGRVDHLLVVVDAGRIGNAVARVKFPLLFAETLRVFFYQRENFLSRLLFRLIFKHASFSSPSLPGRVAAFPELF